MFRSTLGRWLAATFLVVVATGGAARAQEPCNCKTSFFNRSGQPLLATTQLSPSSHDYLRRPTGCWQHHCSDYNCSSLSSELIFVFGGCRQFFGEPCLKAPPVYGDPVAACPTGVGCKK